MYLEIICFWSFWMFCGGGGGGDNDSRKVIEFYKKKIELIINVY